MTYFQNLLEQTRDMGKKFEEMQKNMQEDLEKAEYEGVSGIADMGVQVIVNGNGEIKSINIDQQLMESNETSIVEDLVKKAVNEGISKARSYSQSLMTNIINKSIFSGMK